MLRPDGVAAVWCYGLVELEGDEVDSSLLIRPYRRDGGFLRNAGAAPPKMRATLGRAYRLPLMLACPRKAAVR